MEELLSALFDIAFGVLLAAVALASIIGYFKRKEMRAQRRRDEEWWDMCRDEDPWGR